LCLPRGGWSRADLPVMTSGVVLASLPSSCLCCVDVAGRVVRSQWCICRWCVWLNAAAGAGWPAVGRDARCGSCASASESPPGDRGANGRHGHHDRYRRGGGGPHTHNSAPPRHRLPERDAHWTGDDTRASRHYSDQQVSTDMPHAPPLPRILCTAPDAHRSVFRSVQTCFPQFMPCRSHHPAPADWSKSS
jgi:hypothetical protein